MLLGQRGIAEQQNPIAVLHLLVEIGGAVPQAIDTHATGPRRNLKLMCWWQMLRQAPDKMHPAFRAGYLNVPEMAVQRPDKGIAPPPVGVTDALQVVDQAAVADEPRQCRLLQPWQAVVGQSLQRRGCTDQVARHDNVAQPQPGPD